MLNFQTDWLETWRQSLHLLYTTVKEFISIISSAWSVSFFIVPDINENKVCLHLMLDPAGSSI